jgi:hypothetical protein
MHMGVDGTYKITTKTPMGNQQSVWTLKVAGEPLSGVAESAMTGRTEFKGGTVKGDDFNFNMELDTPMGKIKMDVKGKVEGDKISGNANSPFGPAPFEGTRS